MYSYLSIVDINDIPERRPLNSKKEKEKDKKEKPKEKPKKTRLEKPKWPSMNQAAYASQLSIQSGTNSFRGKPSRQASLSMPPIFGFKKSMSLRSRSTFSATTLIPSSPEYDDQDRKSINSTFTAVASSEGVEDARFAPAPSRPSITESPSGALSLLTEKALPSVPDPNDGPILAAAEEVERSPSPSSLISTPTDAPHVMADEPESIETYVSPHVELYVDHLTLVRPTSRLHTEDEAQSFLDYTRPKRVRVDSGVIRKEAAWTGEWNQPDIHDVIAKLRDLRFES